nr:hypothetical protein CFP56_39959 [Quercus suber]
MIIYYYDESKAGGINLWHNVACQDIIKQVTVRVTKSKQEGYNVNSTIPTSFKSLGQHRQIKRNSDAITSGLTIDVALLSCN